MHDAEIELLVLAFQDGERKAFTLVMAVVLTAVIFWCGYQFVVASPEQQLFWGVWLILAFQAQVAIKLWIFMETNRNHTAREIRRLELRLRQQETV